MLQTFAFQLRLLFLIQLADSLGDIGCRLLHGVQLFVLGHGRRVVAVLGHQLVQPLLLTTALMSRLLLNGGPALFNKRLDNIGSISTVLNSTPLFGGLLIVAVTVEVVQRIVERVGLRMTQDADNLSVGVALDSCLGDDGVLNGCDAEGVFGRGARCRSTEKLLCTAGGSLETG